MKRQVERGYAAEGSERLPASADAVHGGAERVPISNGLGPGGRDGQSIPGKFQLLLALYIILTGDFPTILQALAFGLVGGAGAEFALAMGTSVARDLLLLAPLAFLANHRLGILHPLLLAVVVWPLLASVPTVIESLGGWAGVLVGAPLAPPFFIGLRTLDAATVWTAIAKYNAIEIVALGSTYLGFWLCRSRASSRLLMPSQNTPALRTVLLGVFGVSILVVIAFIYARGGLGEHLTSLGRGRFRELAGMGPILVLTELAAIAIYLWIAARPRDAKSPLFLVCMVVTIVSQFVTDGSRGDALAVPLMVGLIWAVRRQRIPWKVAVLLVPLMFLSLGLLSAVRTSSWSGSTAGEAWSTTSWARSLERAQAEIASRRALSAPVPIVERGFEVSGGPLLGRTYAAAVTAWIPRALWETKPRGPASIYAQQFLGESIQGSAIPIGATAEMYWNFGLPGVALLSVLYGAVLRAAYQFLWRRYPDPYAIVFVLLVLTSFHFSTTAIVPLAQKLAMLFMCYIVATLFVPRRTPALPPQPENNRPFCAEAVRPRLAPEGS